MLPTIMALVLAGGVACGDDDRPSATPRGTAVQSATATPTAGIESADTTATPRTTALPANAPLTLKATGSPPASSVLYTASGCWQCDGPDESMRKHVTDAAGRTTTSTILESGTGVLDGWTIGQLRAAADGSVLAAVVCDASYCGGLGAEKPEATWRIVVSRDGGATWGEAFQDRIEYVVIDAVTDSGLLLTAFAGGPQPARRTFVVSGGNTRQVSRPGGLSVYADPFLLADGRVLWADRGEDGTLVPPVRLEDGSPFPIELPGGARYAQIGSLPGGGLWAIWEGGKGPVAGVFDADGKLAHSYDMTGVYFAAFVEPDLLVGAREEPGYLGPLPTILDLSAGTITPIGAPFGQEPLTGRNRPLALVLN